MDSDYRQDFLFCMLALQNNITTKDALVSSFTNWIADKNQDLKQILIDVSGISDDENRILHSLVELHVRRHDEDIDQSLSAVSIDTVRVELEKLQDTDVDKSLVRSSLPQTQTVHVERAIGVATEYRFQTDHSRFDQIKLHAKGGLGRVYLAKDKQLNREVALKEIIDTQSEASDARIRFLQEAEITGRLEHPGIVPVYALGETAMGAPYYAMRFVRGQTMRKAVSDFHKDKRQLSEPQRKLKLREFLGQFKVVCDAVQYAHSRGVIHRDIKPANIMLGKFGETLVVDWGLAKVVGREESTEQGETTLRTAHQEDSAPTVYGSALGTPSYMPPEQAEGRLNLIGTRSDVYSLGATLFYVLTGQPPVKGETNDEVLEKVRRGETRRPRDVDPSIPRSLEAICLKAISHESSDRYESPNELSNDLDCWLADEPVTARPESVRDRSNRWIRKHPKIVTSTVVATVLGIVGLAAISSLYANTNRVITTNNLKLERKNEELDQLNGQLRDAVEKERRSTQDAIAAKSVAESERSKADAERNFLIDLFSSPHPAQDGLKVRVVDVMRKAVDDIEGISEVPLSQVTVLVTIARLHFQLELFDEAITIAKRAKLAYEQQGLDDLDVYAAIIHFLGSSYSSKMDLQSALPLLTESLQIREKHFGDKNRRTLAARNALAIAYIHSNRPQEALELLKTLEQDLLSENGAYDPALSHVLDNLARAYSDLGQPAKSLEIYNKALEFTINRFGEDNFFTIDARNDLANILMDNGFGRLAKPHLERALELAEEKLEDDHAQKLRLRETIAELKRFEGDFQGAIEIYNETIPIREQKHGKDYVGTMVAKGSLALTHIENMQYKEGNDIFEELYPSMIAVLKPKNQLVIGTLNNWALSLRKIGKIDLALEKYQEALRRQLEITGENAATVRFRNNIAQAYNGKQEHKKAIEVFEDALPVANSVLSPNAPLLNTLKNNYGIALLGLDRLDEAIEQFSQALAGQVPERPHHTNTLATRDFLAMTHLYAGNFEEAIQSSQENLDIRQSLPSLPQNELQIANALSVISRAQFELNEPDKALAAIDRCISIRETYMPTHPVLQTNIILKGQILLANNDEEQAEDLLKKGYQGLTEYDTLHPRLKMRIADAVKGLVEVSQRLNKSDDLTKWKEVLRQIEQSEQPDQ